MTSHREYDTANQRERLQHVVDEVVTVLDSSSVFAVSFNLQLFRDLSPYDCQDKQLSFR